MAREWLQVPGSGRTPARGMFADPENPAPKTENRLRPLQPGTQSVGPLWQEARPPLHPYNASTPRRVRVRSL
jgi:hypothetical protein